ncbi:16129_t:CDS:1 [Funneliformis mosseae]|uniref:16129_t:CDS:1 n=1 Tax=Funneliformis mosseae TaxID=27381 RepID=A0A9N8WMJ6_FUNMO|nr:16129_t:CDS:1 [Funneliformis mosseae]
MYLPRNFFLNLSIYVITKTISNVMSSYISIFITVNLLTVEKVKVKSQDDIKDFLNVRKELDLEDKDINKLYDQRVMNNIFLTLKYKMLVNPLLSIPVRSAIKLLEFINKIQGNKRTSFSHTLYHICK